MSSLSCPLFSLFPSSKQYNVSLRINMANPLSTVTKAPLFEEDSYVEHVQTKNLYRIVETPETLSIETPLGGVPAYCYYEVGYYTQKLVLSQEEMEDGRFEETETYECPMHGINAGDDCPKC